MCTSTRAATGPAAAQRADMHRMRALGSAHGSHHLPCGPGIRRAGQTLEISRGQPGDASCPGGLLEGVDFEGGVACFLRKWGGSQEGDGWAEACGVATGQDRVGRTGEAGFPHDGTDGSGTGRCSPGPGARAGGAPLPRCHSPRQRCSSRSFVSSCCTACFRCRRAWRSRFPSRHRRRAASAICSCRASSRSRLLSGSWGRVQ